MIYLNGKGKKKRNRVFFFFFLFSLCFQAFNLRVYLYAQPFGFMLDLALRVLLLGVVPNT